MLTYPRFQVNRLLTVATEFGIHSVVDRNVLLLARRGGALC